MNTAKTLLLVEDECDLRELTSEHLQELGYRVLEAENGSEALRILSTGARIDLLITDIGLPGDLDGRRVAEEARQKHPDLLIILMSGHVTEHSIPGATILQKPFKPDELTEMVKEKLIGIISPNH